MLEKAYIDCREWIVKDNSLDGSGEDESYRESFNLREHLSSCDQSSGRNTDGKGHSDEVSDREKAILNIRCPRAWLNCVHVLVFCGR